MYKKRIKYLFTKNLLKLLKSFLMAFGTIWLFIEFPSYLISTMNNFIKDNNEIFLFSALIFSIIYGVVLAFPKMNFVRKFKASNTSVTIKVGSIFQEPSHLVIGSSDYFDTDYDKNSNISLKSQMINKLFSSKVSDLDELIRSSIIEQGISGEYDNSKPKGKKTKYPIGTVAVLPQNERKIFLLIIANSIYNNLEKHTESNPQKLNIALEYLWKKIKANGKQKEVSIPVLGTGLAGISLSHLLIIQSIILSFCVYSKKEKITTNLNILIHENNYDPDDFEETCKFLKTIQI